MYIRTLSYILLHNITVRTQVLSEEQTHRTQFYPKDRVILYQSAYMLVLLGAVYTVDL